MPLNKSQQQAKESPLNEDVLISAGAGSGKTRTLSEKVLHHIQKLKELEPSELLALTFTNNSAHDMKTKIMKTFSKADPLLAKKISSAHIQSFDSFMQFIVRKYSSKLGISSNITIIDEAVEGVKLQEIIDSYLRELCQDDKSQNDLFEVVKHFDTRDFTNTKELIKEFHKKTSSLTRPELDELLKEYPEKYLSEASFARWLSRLADLSKEKIKDALYQAYFFERFGSLLFQENITLSSLESISSNRSFYQTDINSFTFSAPSKKDLDPHGLYKAYLTLLRIKEPDKFLSELINFANNNEDLLSRAKKPSSRNLDEKVALTPYLILRNIVLEGDTLIKKDSKPILPYLSGVSFNSKDFKENTASYSLCVLFFLKAAFTVSQRLEEYKKTVNCFTFLDTNVMALSLLQNNDEVAKEVRSQFKYIMIDEYQDTNDLQESLISCLTKADSNGQRAHVFYVGDAKQAIYSFRGSNVDLFRRRQKALLSGGQGNGQVIFMNTNYRSGEKTLHDINYIFRHYMSLENGGIDFSRDEEQLHYDSKYGLYPQKYDDFGVHRLISPSGDYGWSKNLGISRSKHAKIWEAKAIINDIKNKIEKGFKVYDRDSNPPLRPCEYRDFCILVSAKRGFAEYQRLFNECGIPLNLKISGNLREIDAILLIQSIVALLDWKINGTDINLPHVFSSIARSYAFRYDDDKIYEILSYKEGGKTSYKLINEDPIMKIVENFLRVNANLPFSELYLGLLKDFHIIDELHRLGEIESNITKIESFYQMILTEDKAGEGLKEFVALLKSVAKNRFDLEDSTTVQLDNAVELMTIHASKGLEKKIVYLPCSYNRRRPKPNRGIKFDEEFGFWLDVPSLNRSDAPRLKVLDAIDSLNPSKIEKDETARLFYVALTRAENAIYIVGDKTKENSLEGCLYGMLDHCPHVRMIARPYLEAFEQRRFITPSTRKRYEDLADILRTFISPLGAADFIQDGDSYRRYLDDQKNIVLKGVMYHFEKLEEEIRKNAYDGYRKSLKEEDLALAASIFGSLYLNRKNIGDLASLTKTMKSKPEYRELIEEIDDETEEEEDSKNESLEGKEIKEAVLKVYSDLLKENPKRYQDDSSGDSKAKIHDFYVKDFLAPLAYAFEKINDDFIFDSYQSKDFEDKVVYFDEQAFLLQKKPSFPSIPNLPIDNKKLVFVPRVKLRASKMTLADQEDSSQIFERGNLLHRYLELTDFVSKDTSFIKDEKDRKIIDHFLSNPLFSEMEGGKFYKEYGYYDPDLATTGSIDLLLIKDGIYHIIDYKTKKIEDEEYMRQARIYGKNVMRLFGLKKESVKMTLISIMDGTSKEVTFD